MHEIVQRVPLVVVAGFAVQVPQVSPGEVGPVLLDQLEEESVLGALQADGAQSRKSQEQFRKPGVKCFGAMTDQTEENGRLMIWVQHK